MCTQPRRNAAIRLCFKITFYSEHRFHTVSMSIFTTLYFGCVLIDNGPLYAEMHHDATAASDELLPSAVTEDEDSFRHEKSRHWSWFRSPTSWRFGIIVGAACSILALLINVSVTVRAMRSFPLKAGQGMVFGGSCTQSKKLNIAVHLIINALGTILLGASNYCM